MDLISRKAAIDAFDRIPRIKGLGLELLISVSDAKGMLEGMKAVDAAPVKHGRWIHLDPEKSTISGKCSCCGWEAHYYEDDVVDMPYCPSCGAKMDLEE